MKSCHLTIHLSVTLEDFPISANTIVSSCFHATIFGDGAKVLLRHTSKTVLWWNTSKFFSGTKPTNKYNCFQFLCVAIFVDDAKVLSHATSIKDLCRPTFSNFSQWWSYFNIRRPIILSHTKGYPPLVS